MNDAVSASEALHARVRRFAIGEGEESFERLALDIAQFQAAHVPGFARLVERSGSHLDSLDSIPPVPTEAFRATRVSAHPAELDVVKFVTSGTSSDARGLHPFRTTRTYEHLSRAFGRDALLAGDGALVIALAEPPKKVSVPLDAPPAGDESRGFSQGSDSGGVQSSLNFMMRVFVESFDVGIAARWVAAGPNGVFDREAAIASRFLLSPLGIDLPRFRCLVKLALDLECPVLLLSTSAALARLLEQLKAESGVFLPAGSVIMHTGGPKRLEGSLNVREIAAQAASALKLDPLHVVGEYGMTELSSQLYEATVPGARLVGARHVFTPPPWLKVEAVDPIQLKPVEAGEVGLARFIDLGNVDSAVSVVTQDLVKAVPRGVKLLGRQPGAVSRGCSLAVESILEASS